MKYVEIYCLILPPTWQHPGWGRGFHRGREYPWRHRLGIVGGVRGVVRDTARRVTHAAAALRIADFQTVFHGFSMSYSLRKCWIWLFLKLAWLSISPFVLAIKLCPIFILNTVHKSDTIILTTGIVFLSFTLIQAFSSIPGCESGLILVFGLGFLVRNQRYKMKRKKLLTINFFFAGNNFFVISIFLDES